MTAAARLACHRCDWSGALALRQSCPDCGATLRVVHAAVAPPAWDGAVSGVWRYRARLPVGPGVEPVTLGEGATPLLELPLEPGVRVLGKVEGANPTLSFKDRPVSVAATVARELGAAGLLCASTGNTAVAVAAYAARAGLPAACVVPERTPAAKLGLATGAGARVLRVRGTYSDAHALAAALAERSGWANLSSTYLNPFMLEGDKTLAFELVEQLGGRLPDAIVVPVGAGPLLAGVAQGLEELGLATRLHAVQAAGCAPIARAFAESGRVRPWGPVPDTAAGSIADPLEGYPEDGQRTLEAVVRSGGAAVAADDAALRAAAGELARSAGLSVELGAATALAGLRVLRRAGHVRDGETVVLVLTGHGAKDDVRAAAGAAAPAVVDPADVKAAERALEEAVAHG
jgi:threonine synthase